MNDLTFTRSIQRLDSIRGGFVSFFNELDTGKELCSWKHVSFFNEVDTVKETILVSTFNNLPI